MNIDYYARNLTRLGAREVELSPDRPPLFRFGDGDRVAQGNVSQADLASMVAAVAPPQALAALQAGSSPPPFAHLVGGKPYQVTVEVIAGRWKVIVREPAEAPRRKAPTMAGMKAIQAGQLAPTNGGTPVAAPAAVPSPPRPPVAPAVAAPPAPSPAVPRPPSPAAAPSAPRPTVPAAPARAAVTAGDSDPEIHALLHQLVTDKGSDLHLTATLRPMYRVSGNVIPVPGWAELSDERLRRMLYAVMPDRVRQEFEETWDADFAYAIEGLSRFRVNVAVDRHGAYAVIRRIPFEILTPEQIGLPNKVLDLCWLTKGLVLVTGPTGSGKSTTLATLIDYINTNRADHIITIEDPVEFVHPDNKKCLIRQREVGEHTTSFKRALKAALREDPNIVLVGELRDLETIAIAIETAETGHLVFGTLHTSTAPSTVDRLVDQFPADRQEQIRVMLSESLRGVIAQTLCRKIGGGRVAAYEVLIGSKAISNLIREGKTFQLYSLMQTGRAAGNMTLSDSLMTLVKNGVVEPQEAYMRAVNKEEFKGMLEKAGYTVEIRGAEA